MPDTSLHSGKCSGAKKYEIENRKGPYDFCFSRAKEVFFSVNAC